MKKTVKQKKEVNMQDFIKKAEKVCQQTKNYLLAHLDELKFVEAGEHTVDYKLLIGIDTFPVCIWIANGVSHAGFYDSFAMMKLEYIDYTPKERQALWDKAQRDIKRQGEVRKITMSRLSNDLFFSFKGVFGEVRFSGYDDNDWWTKYKPESIKENDEITWVIDLEKMVATYQPKTTTN